MPTPTINSSHAATIKKWNKTALKESLLGVYLRPLMGQSDRAVIQVDPNVQSAMSVPGTGLQFVSTFRPSPNGSDGVRGTDQLKGKEKDLTLYADTLTAQEVAEAVSVRNYDTSQNNTVVNLKDEQRQYLTEWLSEALHYDLMQALVDTSAGRTQARYLYGATDGNWNATHTTALANCDTTNDLASCAFISKLKEKAQLEGQSRIRPAMVGKDEKGMPIEGYCLLMHPYAFRDVRADVNWREREIHSGIGSSGLEKGASYKGTYDGVHVFVIPDNTLLLDGVGNGSADVCHAMLMGGQAAKVGYVQRPSFRPDNEDYDRMQNLGVIEVRGQKKHVFNSEDFGIVHGFTAVTA